MKLFFALLSFLFSISVCAQDFNSEDYIRKFHKMAIAEMHRYSIPASITLAQGILESGNGNSELALKSKNHFGIKCHKGWTGKKTYHDDDQEQECFRRYNKVSDSYRDHSEFLKNSERYAFLFKYKTSDYESWAKGLKKAGYATHPDYATKLINLIKRYNLSQYDSASKSGKRNIKKPKRKDRKEIFKSTDGLKFVLADPGDNFDVIATEQSLWLWQLLEFNDLTSDGSLKMGDRVYLEYKKNRSSVEFHLVKKGETFHSISQLYGVRLAKLYHKNRVEVGAQVQVGQKVFLRKRKLRNYSAE